MGATKEVEDTLPGLRFTVERSTVQAPTHLRFRVGTIHLRCEFTDGELWNAALKKLNGLKLFSSVVDDVVSALGHALDSTEAELRETKGREEELQQIIHEKDREIAELRRLLSSIGIDLGIEH
jgi:hypothetical protein